MSFILITASKQRGLHKSPSFDRISLSAMAEPSGQINIFLNISHTSTYDFFVLKLYFIAHFIPI
jgi:hypothetical protein